MSRLFGSLFGLRREERGLVSLMAAYHFLLLVTLYLLKPVRDSLFLATRGPAELPFVFILTTAVVVPVAILHSRIGKRMALGTLIDTVSLLLILSLVGLRGLLSIGGAWVAYVLYAWVSIYGLLLTSQFWLFANTVFAASQAKRIFTVLSVGAILGAVSGGEITGILVDDVGLRPRNLLWVAAALLAGSVGLARYIRHRHRVRTGGAETHREDAEEAPGDVPGPGEIIFGSSHIQFIVGVIAITVITTTFIDYQFKTVAAQAFASEEALTTFMGRFYGRVSMVALVVQFFLAPRLMKVVGIGGALSILPAGLALGTVGMVVMPGLVAGVLLRGTDQSLKHSIDKTGRELLFVPVALERKKRVKVFIDLFVDQGMQGVGGVLLLAFTLGLGFSVYELSAVVLVLIGAWAWLTYRARHSYTDQFRRQLQEQDDYTPSAEDDGDASLPDDLGALVEDLCGRGEQQTRVALDRLEEGEVTVPVHALRCLLDHQSSSVRAQAIRVLRKRGVTGLGEAVADYLTDPDPDVQLEAARYMYCDAEGNRMRRLQRGLTNPDPRIRAVTVALIAEEGGSAERNLVSEELLRELVEAQGTNVHEQRVQVARMLAVLEAPYRNELLHRLLKDDHPDVVQQAIESAGQAGDRSFVRPLLKRLSEAEFEEAARAAHAALHLVKVRMVGVM